MEGAVGAVPPEGERELLLEEKVYNKGNVDKRWSWTLVNTRYATLTISRGDGK
jgi:hypothetical protein